MGVGTVIISKRVGLLKADGTTPVELPAALHADGGFKVHLQNPEDIAGGGGSSVGDAEDNRSWGYVTEVDDDGVVLVGRKPAAASRPVVLSDEDLAALRQDATIKAGTASATGVFITAFETGSQGFFTLSGATTGSWQDAAGQAGLVAVEGSNDPGPGGGVAPTTGWSALRMENPNGQTTTAPRGGGTFHGEVTMRWMRVNCLVFKAGTYVANLVVFPRPRQLFKHWIGDQDGISRVEVTPGTSRLHTVSPTPLLTFNFDVAIPDGITVTATGSGSAAIVAGQGVKLQTGTTPDSTIRIQSNRAADLVPGLANIVNFFAATEAKAGVGNVTRWGAYDDDSGVFLEQYHDGAAGQLRLRTRKAGVDTTVLLNGTNNISDNGFGVPVFNLYDFYIDPAFVKFRQSGILAALASGLFPTLFSKFSLPLRAEIINSGGAATNKTLYIQYASTVRLGPPLGVTPDGEYGFPAVPGRFALGSTFTPLDAFGIWRGKWLRWQQGYVKAAIDLKADVSGTLYLDYSQEISPSDLDDSGVADSKALPYDPSISPLRSEHTAVRSLWMRARYINGSAAQSMMSLDAAFLVADPGSDAKIAALDVDNDDLSQIVDAIDTSASDDSPSGFVHVKTTRNPTTLKDGKNVHLAGSDVPIDIRALKEFETGQFNVSSSRVEVPAPTIPNPKTLQLTNLHTETRAFWGNDTVLPNSGAPLLPGLPVEMDLDGTVLPWTIADSVVGLSATANRFATGSANNVGVVNPNGMVSLNDIRATFDSLADSVDMTGLTAPGTYPSITQVKLKLQGRKGTNQTTELVGYLGHQTFQGANVGTLACTGITFTPGAFYLVAISVRNTLSVVQNITNSMGFTGATLVDEHTEGFTRIFVYRMTGVPTSSGTITVNLSPTATNIKVGIMRFSGVDVASPIENFENFGDPNSTTYSGSIDGTIRGMAVVLVNMRNDTHTAGSGFTEQFDERTTDVSTNGASLAVSTLALAATGTQGYSGTISDADDFSLVAITLRPATATPPVIRVQTKIGGVISGTPLIATLTATSDTDFEVDITGDRAWDAATIADTDLTLTVDAIGAAVAEVDAPYVELTETESVAVVRIAYAWLGGTDL